MPRTFGHLALVVAAFCATTVEADDKTKQDPSGSWRWMDDQTSTEMTLRFDLKEGGKLEGLFLGMEQRAAVKDCILKENVVTGLVTISVQGSEMLCDLNATFEGDEMTLVSEYQGSVGTGQVTAKPKRSVKPEDIVGKWKLDLTTEDGMHRQPIINFSVNEKNKLAATFTGEDGELEVKEVGIDKSSITVVVESEYDGATVTTTFNGRPYGSKWNGKMEYDFNGIVGGTPFTSKRLVAKKAKKSKVADQP